MVRNINNVVANKKTIFGLFTLLKNMCYNFNRRHKIITTFILKERKIMKRICIIGGSGSGKTTLANNLGKQLHYPVYHIDAIHHLANWKERDKDERDNIIREKIKGKEWIIDGTYTSTLEDRFAKADYIIYLDFSTFTQLKGVLERYIKYGGKEREEIPGCKEKMSWEFFRWVLTWRKRKRKGILERLSKVDSNKVHIFKNRRQLNRWYKKEFNIKMEIK